MKAPSDLCGMVLDGGENNGTALLCSQQQMTAWILSQGDHFHLFKKVLILQQKLGADSARANGIRTSKEEDKNGLYQLAFNFFLQLVSVTDQENAVETNQGCTSSSRAMPS